MLLGVVGLAVTLLSSSLINAAHPTDSLRDADELQSGYAGGNHGMDPAVVGGPTFGQLWNTITTSGEVFYAKVLTYTPPPSTDTSQQMVLAFSTLNNVYQLNATTGAIINKENFGEPFATSDSSCSDLGPNAGITGTPVLDASSGIVYFWVKTYDGVRGPKADGFNGVGRYKFYAIDAVTLQTISGYPKDPQGTPADNNPKILFNAGIILQRPALLLKNGVVYAAFGGNCDSPTYYGWIAGYRVSDGTLAALWTPEAGPQFGQGGGIWMAGGGISTDGTSLYITTGNGFSGELTKSNVRSSTTVPQTLGESVVKLQIGTNGSLLASQFFTPYDYANLDAGDKDFGSTPFSLLDRNTFRTSTISGLGFCAGKGAEAYFLDTANLGGYRTGSGGTNAVVQDFSLPNAVFAAVGSYPLEGGYAYITPVNGYTSAYAFSASGSAASFSLAGQSTERSAGRPGVGPASTTSLNGQPGTGLLWMTDVENGAIRIYSAVPQNGVLNTVRIIPGGMSKYQRVAFGDKKAFVGADGRIAAFGAPVNLPLACTSIDFGSHTVDTNNSLIMNCTANIPVTIQSINTTNQVFMPDKMTINALVKTSLATGSSFSIPVVFRPVYKATDPNTKVSYGITSPGAVAGAINFYTANDASPDSYSTFSPITVKGIAVSAKPFVSVNPNNLNVGGVILDADGGNAAGKYLEGTAVLSNIGSQNMTIQGFAYQVIDMSGGDDDDGDDDAPVLMNYTTSPFADGAWSIFGLPVIDSVVAPTQKVSVLFRVTPRRAAKYQIQFYMYTDGGVGTVGLSGSANTAPVALLGLQQWNSSGAFLNSTIAMDFGALRASGSETRQLQMSLTNDGKSLLTITKSKPPGLGAIVQLGDQLPEGDSIGPGESKYATLQCGPPYAVPNTLPQVVSATWVLNTDDLTFGVHDIRLIGTAVAKQIGPLLTNSSGQYRYFGCYDNAITDGNNNVIARNTLISDDRMENGLCQGSCYAKGYLYAATNYGNECFCATSLTSAYASYLVDDSLCNYACEGDSDQNCGGPADKVSIYADSTRILTPGSGSIVPDTLSAPGRGGPPSTLTANSLVYSYMGCYNDLSGKMPEFITPAGSAKQTLETCTVFCASNYPYNFIGVEYGHECRCANEMPKGQVQASKPEECSIQCPGNSAQPCGGGDRISLYRLQLNDTHVPSSSTIVIQRSTLTSRSRSPSMSPATTEPGPSTFSPSVSAFSSSRTSSLVPQSSSLQVVGCYADGNTRTYPITLQVQNNSVANCAVSCAAAGYGYSGTEYSTECYCSSSSPTSAISSNCNMVCPGNGSEICGGGYALSVVYKPDVIPRQPYSMSSQIPQSAATIRGFADIGCFTDGGTRALKVVRNPPTQGWTRETCISSCAMSGYTLAGLEYANECYCDSSFDDSGGAGAPSTGCTMACKGDTTQMCGGSLALNIFQKRPVSSSMASTSMPVTIYPTGDSASPSSNVPSSSASSSRSPLAIAASSSTSAMTELSSLSPLSSSTSLPGATVTSSTSIVSSTTPSSRTIFQSSFSTSLTIESASTSTTAGLSTSSTPTGTIASTTSFSTGFSTLSRTTSPAATSSITSASTTTKSSTVTTTTSSSSTSFATPAAWVYQGCFVDRLNPRSLNAGSTTDSAMTIQKCTSFCEDRAQPYAGLEYGNECYCGSSLMQTSSQSCTSSCAGDSSINCGGPAALSVFYNSNVGNPPSINVNKMNYTSAGCYKDDSSRYLNSAVSMGNSTMTLLSCVTFCSDRGFKIAGAEYGNECYCGNSLGNSSVLLSPNDCLKVCPGQTSTTCGGGFSMNIYNATVFR